jgi:hypothetical protein
MVDPEIAAAADAKVQAALDHVEAAQRQLDQACQALSPIIGGLSRYQRLCRLHQTVHADWHRLNEWARAHRGKLDLDESGHRALAEGRP